VGSKCEIDWFEGDGEINDFRIHTRAYCTCTIDSKTAVLFWCSEELCMY